MKTISHVFTNTFMGYGHRTLRTILETNLRQNHLFKKQFKARPGLLLFTNASLTGCKLFDPEKNVIAYLKLAGGALTSQSLDDISIAFGGHGFDLSSQVIVALKLAREQKEKRSA